MNTEQMKYLIEVSQHNSMTAASEKLFMTSQALSIAIKKMEDELGFPLLNRSYKGVSLTEDGVWMVDLAEQFLAEIEKRKQIHEIHASSLRNGSLEILVNVLGIGSSILSQLICILYQQEPNLRIHLNEISKEDVLIQILNDKNEFGFIFRTQVNNKYIDTLEDSLMFEPLFHGKCVVMASTKYDFTKFESTSMKKIMKYPAISYTTRLMFNSLHNLITNVLHLEYQETLENNYDIFKQKLLLGHAITIGAHFEVEDHPTNYIDGLKVIPLRDDIRIDFGMVKKKDTILTEHSQFFMSELKILIEQLTHNKKA